MLQLIDRRPNEPRQERRQPRALPAPLQVADPGGGEEDGRRAQALRHGAGRRSARADEGHLRAVVRLRPRRRPRVRAAGQSRVRRRRPHPAAAGRRAAAAATAAAATATARTRSCSRCRAKSSCRSSSTTSSCRNLARTEFGRTEQRTSMRAGFTKTGVAGQSRDRPHAAAVARAAHRARRQPRARARGAGSRVRHRRGGRVTPSEAARDLRGAASADAAPRRAAVHRRAGPALPQSRLAARADRAGRRCSA